MSDSEKKTLDEVQEQFQSEDVSPEPQAQQNETTNAMEDKQQVNVPEGDELVTMSKQELKDTMKEVMDEYDKRIQEAESRMEKLQLEYEKKEKKSYINRRGQESTANRIQVNQSGPLNPIDHQSRLLEQHKDKLKGKVPRFVTTGNEELYSLRRTQGYEPVRDEDGNEVRYMDGVLMAMPEGRYREDVQKPKEERKALHRSSIEENFKQQGESQDVRTEGNIQFDVETNEEGG